MSRSTPVRALSALRRVATLSVHTSPLDQPGTGDAGGLNVYVVELSRRLAAVGIEVDIFTRTTSSGLPATVELEPGITVRHVNAGPFEGLSKNDLPAQLCAFTSGVLRAEAVREPGYYDLVHSHYWLSGQVGWLASERWRVPLVHTFHTLARVKNAALAADDEPEPTARVIGEEQVVAAATRLVASTDTEAAELVSLYDARPDQVCTIAPGVDLNRFSPGPGRAESLAAIGLPADAVLLLFVGRVQPLKAPDVLLRAAAVLLQRDPSLRARLRVDIVGGPSGTGTRDPENLVQLAQSLHLGEVVRFLDPVHQERLAEFYRAAEVVVVPSYNESFGLVALEAQACGTPVVAARVGGLRTAVRDGVSGVLVDGHDPGDFADVIAALLASPERRATLSAGAVTHAAGFGWAATAEGMLSVYADALREHAVSAAAGAR
ncbi:MAG TPA: D-inositol-3-phosphate glycosyltransferase [Mycobacteriales bacterium]|nr:D-inositol-3-phosphate glycosyltransferase [Mycobacteriales bacterium]